MKIKMLKSSLWADVAPHLPHINLVKDKEYSNLHKSVALSIVKQGFGVEVVEIEDVVVPDVVVPDVVKEEQQNKQDRKDKKNKKNK